VTADTYTCDRCSGTFETDRTEVDCLAECAENFGFVPEDRATICEDCYQEFMEWARAEGLARTEAGT